MEKLNPSVRSLPSAAGPRANFFLDYFKFTLNIGYVTFLIPFRLGSAKVNDEDGHGHGSEKCIIVRHRWHQIACGLVHALILYECFAWGWLLFGGDQEYHLKRFHSHNHNHGPDGNDNHDHGDHGHGHGNDHRFNSIESLQHFTLVLGLAPFLCLIFTFWTKRHKFEVLIRLVDQLEFYGEGVSNLRREQAKIYVLGSLITAICMGLALTDNTMHETTIIHGRLHSFIKSFFVEAQRLYLFRSNDLVPDTVTSAYALEGLPYTLLALLVTIIHALVAVPQFFVYHVVVDVFVLMSAIALWSSAKKFLVYARKHVRSGDDCDMELVLEQYELLKSLVRTVNAIAGVLFLCSVSISIPFYVLWAANSYFNVHNSIHFFIYFGLFFALLAIAADMHVKVGLFYNWICTGDHAEKISPNKMVTLSMDMNSNQIALRGAGVFTMTYRFFGTILSLLVTYTVLIIQYQNSCSSSGEGLRVSHSHGNWSS